MTTSYIEEIVTVDDIIADKDSLKPESAEALRKPYGDLVAQTANYHIEMGLKATQVTPAERVLGYLKGALGESEANKALFMLYDASHRIDEIQQV